VQIDVRFRCDDGVELPGVLSMPDSNDGVRRPGLLLVYEILGMNDEMKRVARDLASEGYVVLIPDLFARGPLRPICVARALRSIAAREGRELDDLEAARRWLAARPEVDPERLGVIGFCMGGGFALVLAMTDRYRAVAPFYGAAPDPMPRSCPVVASYGGRDVPFAKMPARLEKNLRALGVAHDVKVYPDAGHAFFTKAPGGILGKIGMIGPLHAGHHEASATDARARVLAFFAEHLAR
jgi:carboxymethylenebutenolidase